MPKRGAGSPAASLRPTSASIRASAPVARSKERARPRIRSWVAAVAPSRLTTILDTVPASASTVAVGTAQPLV